MHHRQKFVENRSRDAGDIAKTYSCAISDAGTDAWMEAQTDPISVGTIIES